MKPTFNVREQSEIYIGPTADILSGVLPEGRVIVVSDATIDRLYHPLLAPYDTVLIGAGESITSSPTRTAGRCTSRWWTSPPWRRHGTLGSRP